MPNNKWINYKFELQRDVSEMAGQEISIHSQNVIGCLDFLIGYLSFYHNQTHKPSCVFNKNEHQIDNEIYTGEW